SLPFGELRVRDSRSYLHALRAQPACLTDNAAEDRRDALLVERARVLLPHAGQHLFFALAVVRGQAGSGLDDRYLAGDRGTLVEQAQQFGIERIDFQSP